MLALTLLSGCQRSNSRHDRVGHQGVPGPWHQRKVDTTLRVFDECLDADELAGYPDLPRTDVVTPLMFEANLEARTAWLGLDLTGATFVDLATSELNRTGGTTPTGPTRRRSDAVRRCGRRRSG